MSYVVIADGQDHAQYNSVTTYATRAAAERALQQYLAYLRAQGATITGDLQRGYAAVWQEAGQHVSMRITLGQVQ